MWFYLLVLSLACLAVYFFNQLYRGITRSSTCLFGKTAIITGANSGVGYHTALNLASRGCRVIMADVADMQESQRNIIKYTNNQNVVAKTLDLSSLKSVREFASDIIRSEKRLDILLNNAGIFAEQKRRTGDGLEATMQVNYFGHFLLTHLLIDLLKKSAPSRIVFTSSVQSFVNNLQVSNLNFDAEQSQMSDFVRQFLVYGNSKLAILIASDIFAEKLKGTGVTANCLHPGIVSTPIFSRFYSIFDGRLVDIYSFLFCKSPWEGSQVLVHAAVSNKLKDVTGKFFVDCRPFFKPLYAHNSKFCAEIWKASEEYVNLKSSEKL